MNNELEVVNQLSVETSASYRVKSPIKLDILLCDKCSKMQDMVMHEIAECEESGHKFTADPLKELSYCSELVNAPLSGFTKLKQRISEADDSAIYEQILEKHSQIEGNMRPYPLLVNGQWFYLAKLDGVGIAIYIVRENIPTGELNKNIHKKLQEIVDSIAIDEIESASFVEELTKSKV